MANFTLFLIHCIGVHRDASWTDRTIELLEQAWQQDIKLNSELSEHIEIVPINYAEVFEDYLHDFADLSKAVFNEAIELPQSERQQLAQTLQQHKITDRHFIWSYLVDVVLYKMWLVREQANIVVAKQPISTL